MHIPVQPSASQYFSSIDSGMNDAASMMSALGSSSSTGGSGRQSGQHQFQDTFPGRDWLLRAGAGRRLGRRSLMTPERWLWFLSSLLSPPPPPCVFQGLTPSLQRTRCRRRTRGKDRGPGQSSLTCRERGWRRDLRSRNTSPNRTESSWLPCSA